MESQINREYHLVARPVGQVKESDFQLIHAPIPVPGPGQAVARTLYLSLDPANRVWMNERASYMPPVKLGDVMRGFGMAQVVASNNPQLPVGTVVQGLTGWRDYLLIGDGAEQMMPVVSGLQIPLATMMGVLGITGLTAYFGLTEIGKPKAGETVVISAAAGATGSVAGQIAKQLGCRVVGIAGSDDKCAWLTQELGFDAAINYKHADWQKQLGAACPAGIDVIFENVGGEILDASLARINLHARIILCGLIASYNAEAPVPGPYNFGNVLMRRGRIEGFIVTDFVAKFPAAVMQLAQWHLAGKLKHRDTIVDGLQLAPTAINRLFDGSTTGKLLIKVADAPLPIP
jgi:hypothetical protein